MVSIAPIKMVIFLWDGANGILRTTLYAMQWLGGSGSEPGVYIYIYIYIHIYSLLNGEQRSYLEFLNHLVVWRFPKFYVPQKLDGLEWKIPI